MELDAIATCNPKQRRSRVASTLNGCVTKFQHSHFLRHCRQALLGKWMGGVSKAGDHGLSERAFAFAFLTNFWLETFAFAFAFLTA